MSRKVEEGTPGSGREEPQRTEARRADARRNRARVLEAAEQVFAARGTSASTGEIARAAGVGIGTVFRHFPTKEALLEAILIARMQRLADEADALATAADPGAAFFTFFQRMVEQSATKKAFSDALALAGVDVQSLVAPVARTLGRNIGVLLSRAQEAGVVRPDVRVGEVIALFKGVAHSAEHAGKDSALQARTLAIVFDGLRAR
jgi:AcrR family transcriptional regulator